MTIEAQALFKTTDEALIFAFNYADQQFACGLMSRLYAQNKQSGKGLIGLDGAGEAGMIMADVRRLDQPQQDILCICFTKVTKQCACCGSHVQTLEVNKALLSLESWLLHNAYPRAIEDDSKDDFAEDTKKTKKKTAANFEYSDDEKNKILNSLNLSLVRSVVYDFFGLKPMGTVTALATLEGVHRNTASKYQEWIKKALRKLKIQAYNNIDQRLKAAGKVSNDDE